MSNTTLSQLIVHSSSHSPSQIVEKLKKIFQEKGMTLFALVNHSEAAHDVGLELQEMQLLIFGDPKTGTFLMQENPAIGFELPLKILIWKNKESITNIAYKDPTLLADIYGIKKNVLILKKMKESLDALINNVKK